MLHNTAYVVTKGGNLGAPDQIKLAIDDDKWWLQSREPELISNLRGRKIGLRERTDGRARYDEAHSRQ